ncbi:MAG TPA: hemerythrin domain-containing protein [Burkholderiaceae bacterium]|nr:hemerythrin domain-containing protein [Burkholderiaceae bacterium]
MADPIEAWRKEHEYFARLLRLLQKQVDVFHAGGEPKYALMQDIVAYLRDYSDRFHHPREDVAFARLVPRCPDLELIVARLQQEHRVIANAGAKLLEQIEAVLGGEILPREQLETAAATYLVYYQNHIRTEDAAILGRAAEHLNAEDWQAVRAAVPVAPDPVFGADPQERFRELRRQIALEAVAED